MGNYLEGNTPFDILKEDMENIGRQKKTRRPPHLVHMQGDSITERDANARLKRGFNCHSQKKNCHRNSQCYYFFSFLNTLCVEGLRYAKNTETNPPGFFSFFIAHLKMQMV